MRSLLLTFAVFYGSIAVSAQNVWTRVADFGGLGRDAGFAFALDTDGDGIEDKGYVGSGWNSNGVSYTDLWEYDPIVDAWTQKADYPGLGTRCSNVFVLDNIAYVIGGAYGGNGVSKEVWTYSHATNTWSRKNDFPVTNWGAETLVINNKAYLVAGNNNGNNNNPDLNMNVYEYDSATDSWITKNPIPFLGRQLGISFQLDTNNDGVADRAFIGCGGIRIGVEYSDMWEYLPATDSWVSRASVPPTSTRGVAQSFGIRDKGYVGLGTATTMSKDLYEYDPVQDTWTRMSDYPGSPVHGSIPFTVNDEAFVACGKWSLSSVGIREVYKYAPLLNGYSEIKGNIFADGNASCTLDGAEFPIANMPVQAMPGQYLTSTDVAGNYVFRVPVGTYSVAPIIPLHLLPVLPGVGCPASGFHDPIVINTLGVDTGGFDFGITAVPCPRLSVQVASSGRLRCFFNQTVISYCNYGLATENSVYIVLSLPGFITINSSSHAFTNFGGNSYRFEIGQLAGGECGEIHIVDYVSCLDINLLGAAACTEAYIYPQNTCLPQDTAWSGANVAISALCLGGDTVQLTIANSGSGDMTDSSELRIYFDGILGYTENFQLTQGDSYTLLIPSGGLTIMAEADQANAHPYGSHVTTWMERCSADTLPGPLFTIIPQFPLGDGYEQYDVECLEVAGSFDPNDKQAFPSGVTDDNIIPPGTTINYKLRFQNTGTDTARNVYLVDTLDNNLDVASLRVNASSHPYRMELSGMGETILTFYYDNIMLPDSNVNEPLSHGFVNFSITPKANTPLGTVIDNFADIYFDFNPPVRTNTAMLTIDNLPVDMVGVKEGNVIVVSGIRDWTDAGRKLRIFPNPATNILNIVADFPANGQIEVTVVDMLGRSVLSQQYRGIIGQEQTITMDVDHLPAGIYLVAIVAEGKFATAKLIKE